MRLLITILVATITGFALVGVAAMAQQVTTPADGGAPHRVEPGRLPVGDAIRVVLERTQDRVRRSS